MGQIFEAQKSPDSVIDYLINWDDVLTASDPDDTIVSFTATADDVSGLVVNSANDVGNDTVAEISGGTAGAYGTITFQIVTTGGRTRERLLNITVVPGGN